MKRFNKVCKKSILVIVFLLLSSSIQWTMLIPSVYAEDLNEPNNMLAEATAITFNNHYTGVINSADDQDWFELQTTESGTVSVRLNIPVDKNYEIDIVDADQAIIGQGLEGLGMNENVTFTSQPGSTYYIHPEFRKYRSLKI